MKKQTSRAYIMSQRKLRNEIYSKWNDFYRILNQGPQEMKKYLCDLWNSIGIEEINPEFELIDFERVVTENDFNVTMNILNGINVFYFILPDSDFEQAQAKCVALALTPKIPRYFTMEYSSDFMTGELIFVMGEWSIEENNFIHKNYVVIPNGTIANFAHHIDLVLKQN